jgi:hypothetical protein
MQDWVQPLLHDCSAMLTVCDYHRPSWNGSTKTAHSVCRAPGVGANRGTPSAAGHLCWIHHLSLREGRLSMQAATQVCLRSTAAANMRCNCVLKAPSLQT